MASGLPWFNGFPYLDAQALGDQTQARQADGVILDEDVSDQPNKPPLDLLSDRRR